MEDPKTILMKILNHKHNNNDVTTRLNSLDWSCRGTSFVGVTNNTTNNNDTNNTTPSCTIPLWQPTMLCQGPLAFDATMHGHEFLTWKYFVDHFSGYPIDYSGPYPIIQKLSC
eukprot:GHVR01101108.1.p2 GENE.GHVR01101108.1~~GHVR01101108.1.p2  ORF type:complete len:124 (-),score=15.89 GHVR01101108.1:182-520(-)